MPRSTQPRYQMPKMSVTELANLKSIKLVNKLAKRKRSMW